MNSIGSLDTVDVTILMSVYNGEHYIREQLDSIRGQSYSRWKLIVRDDGSSDYTREIVRAYASMDPRIKLAHDDAGNLRPGKSFMRLCAHVDTPFFMFADQDDVWLPNKVELTVSRLDNTPLPQLVFTDLKVVDSELKEVSASFMRYSRFDPAAGADLKHAIFQNVVVGCTIAGNASLLDASGLRNGEIPEAALMHDWWLALVAICFGRLTYIDSPTILYRQHGGNSLGAKTSGFFNYFRLLRKGKPWLRAQSYLKSVIAQTQNFELRFAGNLDATQLRTIRRVSTLEENTLARLIWNYLHGIRMHALDRNIALWLSFLFGKRTGGFL